MTIKPWMTKVLTVLLLVIGYVMHNNWIPPGYMLFGRVNLAGLLTDGMALLAALGLSGPQLSPALSKMLGNPGAPKPPEPPAP
jgi:hypothetical protein